MWSPTTNTKSDNKKKEEVEDCSCNSGSDSVTVSSSASSLPAVTPQKLNTFETNSKKQSLPFGGNLSTASNDEQQGDRQNAKDKEFAFANEQGGDSGFISGPQTSELFQQEFDTEKDNSSNEITTGTTTASASALPVQKSTITGTTTSSITKATSGDAQNNVQKYNIRVAPSVDQQQQKQQHQQEILDSGCIDVDDDNDDNSAEYTEHDEVDVKKINEHIFTKQSATGAVQLQQQEQQLNETAYKKRAAPKAASSNTEQMILKQNVDAGMSEWFCNLSLQTEPPPISAQQQQPQQQTEQQQEIASIGLNNLNGSGNAVRKSIPTSASAAAIIDGKSVNLNHIKQQQQQQSSGNTTTPTTTAQSTNVTPATAWEQFYQQNDDGDTPLHLACISGYVDVVAALMRMAPHPCLFNIQNDEAQTPLHLAALTAQPKILRMLLIAGAEPTIRDRHGNTALHLACISGEEQCVRALTIPISASEINEAHRQYGHRSNDKTVSYLSCARLPSDLEIRNYDGERCVHLAAQAGHIDILRILVLYGADINAREGKSGRTPLHIAIECCNEDLANFLLDECQKLNLETATYAGLTAYQVACILNKSQMQNMLERRGAEPLTPPDSDYDSDIEDLDDSKIYDRFGDPGYFVNYNGGNPMTVA